MPSNSSLENQIHFLQKNNLQKYIDLENSFYCGDAAGRKENKNLKIKKDFSSSDYKFATNLNLKFLTPENLFLKDYSRKLEKISKIVEFDPRKKIENDDNSEIQLVKSKFILLAGIQGSGKTTLALYLKNRYENEKNETCLILNQDQLKTKAKIIFEIKRQATNYDHIIIDRTHGKINDRKEIIEAATAAAVATGSNSNSTLISCYFLSISKEMTDHNLFYRKIIEPNSEAGEISSITVATTRKYFTDPEKSEGFEKVIRLKDDECIFQRPKSAYYNYFLV